MITGRQIADGSIATVDLADGAVTLTKLAPGVVQMLEPLGGFSLVARGQSLAESTSSSSEFQTKLEVTVDLQPGTYRLGYCAKFSCSRDTAELRIIQTTGTPSLIVSMSEDAGNFVGFLYLTVATARTYAFSLQYTRSQSRSAVVAISNAAMEFLKVKV